MFIAICAREATEKHLIRSIIEGRFGNVSESTDFTERLVCEIQKSKEKYLKQNTTEQKEYQKTKNSQSHAKNTITLRHQLIIVPVRTF